MPFAPQTIQIRYGDMNGLGALAANAGRAEYNYNQSQINYRNWLQRDAVNSQMVNSARASQDAGAADAYREEATLDRPSYPSYGQPSPYGLQEAYAPRFAAARTGGLTGPGKFKSPLDLQLEQQRLANATAAGESTDLRNQRLRNKMAAPKMVPVTGPIAGPQGSMSMTVHQPDGGQVSYDGSDMPYAGNGVYPGASTTQEMVPLQVRKSMDAIDALPGLDVNSKTAIKKALQNGLPMQQAFVEARNLTPKRQPQSTAEKAIALAQVHMAEMDSAAEQGPDAAKRYLMKLYPNDYNLPRMKPDQVMQVLKGERGRLAGMVSRISQPKAGPAAAPDNAPPPGSAPGTGPAPGTQMDGHVFNGGDPADPANWEPIQ